MRALLYQKVLKVGREREIPENSDVIGFPKGIAKIDALPAAASDYNYAGTEFGALSLVCLLVQIELGGNFSLRRARNRRRCCRSSQNFLFFLGNCNCAVFMKEKVPVPLSRWTDRPTALTVLF